MNASLPPDSGIPQVPGALKRNQEMRYLNNKMKRTSWAIAALILATLAAAASAQVCPAPDDAQYPTPATVLTYPMNSDQYEVQYRLDGGPWTNARVYISIYGGTYASPYEPYSNYLPFTNYPAQPTTSMSFVSIPARANATVSLRVVKRGNGPFVASDHVYVRPGAKGIPSYLMPDGSVVISTRTSADFAGEQFVLWWDRDATDGGAVQGLAFFLDPPYDPPSGNVAVLNSQTDFSTLDLHGYDAVDFEGPIVLTGKLGDIGPEGPGAQELVLPPNINTAFLGPGSWVQGKIRFDQGDASYPGGQVQRIYGPGVLDSSRFNYVFRQCRNATGDVPSPPYTGNQLDGYETLSWVGNPATPDTPVMDGIVITDSDYNSAGNILNGQVNNVKVIGWNGNNDGFQMADGTRASNVFVRTGDDSLELWGNPITVTNATVWQNDSGGVVNLGWDNKFFGDGNLVDGLYVLRTDWNFPSKTSWITDAKDVLSHQDNGVIVSLMTPGTIYGKVHPPLFRNIFLDDTPLVLFSLKILPPDCALKGLMGGVAGCPDVVLTDSSVVNLNIENVFAPQSTLQNSIGFNTLPVGFDQNIPPLASQYTLTGTMNIGLTNIFIRPPNQNWTLLNSANGASVGLICTNGVDAAPVGTICTNASNVSLNYNFNLFVLIQGLIYGF